MQVTNNLKPTEDDLRRWAFEEDTYLLEQDEDLIILNCHYLPTLLRLSQDQLCLKSSYILDMAWSFARSASLRADDGLLRAIGRVSIAINELDGPEVAAWRSYVARLLDWRSAQVGTDSTRALAMAQDMLVGNRREGTLALAGQAGDEWHVQFTTARQESLFIDARTGRFRYVGPFDINRRL